MLIEGNGQDVCTIITHCRRQSHPSQSADSHKLAQICMTDLMSYGGTDQTQLSHRDRFEKSFRGSIGRWNQCDFVSPDAWNARLENWSCRAASTPNMYDDMKAHAWLLAWKEKGFSAAGPACKTGKAARENDSSDGGCMERPCISGTPTENAARCNNGAPSIAGLFTLHQVGWQHQRL